MSKSAFHIAVFCKAPVAGSVKTRLIPGYGAEGAAKIYVQLVERTLATVRTTCDAYNASASLWVADDIAHEAVQGWSHQSNLPTYRQEGADLGARMLHCLQTMCAEYNDSLKLHEHKPVLLIGTDCPAFASDHLLGAATALTASCPWVFTPADDGGYVLVGSNAPSAEPFVNIAWSTSEVMAQTRTALTAANLRWAETASLWDVDTPADVTRMQREFPKS